MIKHINLQLFAEGDTNPDEKKETNLDNKQEPAKEGFSIRKAFGLLDKKEPEKKEPAKAPETKPADKPDEKPAEKQDEAKEKPEKPAEEEYDVLTVLGKEKKVPVSERKMWMQKGMDYDFVKGEKVKAEATLKRIAQAEGFDTVDKYLAELDKREKAKLAEQIEEAVGDPDKINEIVENHPVVKQTKEEKRKLDYVNAKVKLGEDRFFKELEPELDRLMEANPTAQPDLVYKIIRSDYLTPEKISEFITKEKESAERKAIADAHDKERRSTPKGGDSGDSKDVVTPSGFTSRLSEMFGVSAQKVAQRSHEKMKRS